MKNGVFIAADSSTCVNQESLLGHGKSPHRRTSIERLRSNVSITARSTLADPEHVEQHARNFRTRSERKIFYSSVTIYLSEEENRLCRWCVLSVIIYRSFYSIFRASRSIFFVTLPNMSCINARALRTYVHMKYL